MRRSLTCVPVTFEALYSLLPDPSRHISISTDTHSTLDATTKVTSELGPRDGGSRVHEEPALEYDCFCR
jgi:hypothetical protein